MWIAIGLVEQLTIFICYTYTMPIDSLSQTNNIDEELRMVGEIIEIEKTVKGMMSITLRGNNYELLESGRQDGKEYWKFKILNK